MSRPRAALFALYVLCSNSPDAFAQDDRAAREERRALRVEDVGEGAANEALQAQAREAHLKEMAFARQLLASADLPQETRADLTLRLAELTLEESRYWLDVEMLAFEEAQAACERSPGCVPSDLKPDHAESRRWQRQSVRLCEELLKSAPHYARADEVLYLLGITHMALGEV